MVFRTHPYDNILGPSMRYIFDFGSPDYINMILPAGESGNFISDHYSDMTEMWLEGKYIKLPLRENEFRSTAKNILTLNPQ